MVTTFVCVNEDKCAGPLSFDKRTEELSIKKIDSLIEVVEHRLKILFSSKS